MNHLQQKTTRLEENAAKVGLKLNDKKCKVMKVNNKSEEKLKLLGNDVEEEESFTYLGAYVRKDGGGTADIKKRIALASAQFKRLSNIWQAGDINRKTKTSLFKSLVLPVLLYGCKTWKLTKGEEGKLDIFQNKCLRRIFKIRRQQHISNNTVLEMAEVQKISAEVRRRRWNWIGHILRKDSHDDCAVALGWTPEGRRKSGRPKKRGGEWWRRRGMALAGEYGLWRAEQLRTDTDGGLMSKPCVPLGTERFKVKVRMWFSLESASYFI